MSPCHKQTGVILDIFHAQAWSWFLLNLWYPTVHGYPLSALKSGWVHERLRGKWPAICAHWLRRIVLLLCSHRSVFLANRHIIHLKYRYNVWIYLPHLLQLKPQSLRKLIQIYKLIKSSHNLTKLNVTNTIIVYLIPKTYKTVFKHFFNNKVTYCYNKFRNMRLWGVSPIPHLDGKASAYFSFSPNPIQSSYILKFQYFLKNFAPRWRVARDLPLRRASPSCERHSRSM